jgi:uncharacterized protein involved in response to NO
MSLLTIEEPATPPTFTPWQTGHPVWQLAFRPFYLVAALFAALAMPLWMAQYLGWMQVRPHVDLAWHMHEMVFGVAMAVVVGFLFTAGRAWTGLWTPRHGHLAGLVALWFGGRVAMLTGPAWLAALLDLPLLPLAALAMYRVLSASGNKRNLFLVALLSALTVANGVFHAIQLGWLAASPVAPIQAAILIIVLIESVIGARVIPMFTRNGAPGTLPVVHERRDSIALGLTVAAVLAWISHLPAPAFAGFALAAASAMALRWGGWKPHRTLGVPLLWILHLSYAWIPVGFVLLALAALGVVSSSAAFHALTVGSMAGLIIGMMTRTSLGHTGRPLTVGRAEVAMYWLIQIGALARLCAAIGPAAAREAALVIAATGWTLAFALFVLTYARYLWQPRLDGKEG